MRIEHLTDDSAAKRKTLEHETTETLTSQIELDKTAEEFRRAHQERQELIRQWEQTIEQMQRRDREMDMLAAVSHFSITNSNLHPFHSCCHQYQSGPLTDWGLSPMFRFKSGLVQVEILGLNNIFPGAL